MKLTDSDLAYNKAIGAIQALRANRAHWDTASGQEAMNKALAVVRAYATTYAEAAVKAERERLEPDARRWQMHMRMLHKNHGARQVRELFDAVERAIAEENT